MRIGIAIPSYRGKHYIGETLRSLITQTHRDWFCVVVNDGVEDGTGDVIRGLGDVRIRYVADGQRRGQFANFNRAIFEVLKDDPDVIRLLCSDDVLYSTNLEDVVRVFAAHPAVGLVASHFDGIDEAGRLLFRADMAERDDLVMAGREYLLKGLSVGNTIGGPSSVAIRREALETAGVFDTRVNHSGEADLWHRVARQWDMAWVGRRAGLQYRIHSASITERERHNVARYTDQIQLVRRVASTETLFGARWWVHQYTIGRLLAINVQLMGAFALRREWHGFAAALRGSLREGLIVYAPLWVPRIPYQIFQRLRGQSPSRRLLWRAVHERLQPRRIPVGMPENAVLNQVGPARRAPATAAGNRKERVD